ncbi:hypothetical protein LXL04_001872 [Taraxacum kok-saghyz]
MLKFFNTRACQLVLGAGAMQVSGLKSITSKHLALASQVVSFVHAIIPEIRRILFLKVPETRKVLLLSEIERVSQDYKVHRDEIHTKLVQIMRERLLVHLRGLPQIIETWNRTDESAILPFVKRHLKGEFEKKYERAYIIEANSDNQDSVEDSSLSIETAQSTTPIKSPRFKKRTQFKLYRLIDESDEDVDETSSIYEQSADQTHEDVNIESEESDLDPLW